MRINLIILGFALLLTACTAPKKKEEPTIDPRLTRPEVRKVWVPDKISGDEYEAGHWKYVIQKNSSWAKEEQ